MMVINENGNTLPRIFQWNFYFLMALRYFVPFSLKGFFNDAKCLLTWLH